MTAGLHPVTKQRLALLKTAATKQHLAFRVNSGYRSMEAQAALIRRFEAGDPTVIDPAPVGRSTHQFGLAVDVEALDRSRQSELQALARAAGFFTIAGDPVHLQIIPPNVWAQILASL